MTSRAAPRCRRSARSDRPCLYPAFGQAPRFSDDRLHVSPSQRDRGRPSDPLCDRSVAARTAALGPGGHRCRATAGRRRPAGPAGGDVEPAARAGRPRLRARRPLATRGARRCRGAGRAGAAPAGATAVAQSCRVDEAGMYTIACFADKLSPRDQAPRGHRRRRAVGRPGSLGHGLHERDGEPSLGRRRRGRRASPVSRTYDGRRSPGPRRPGRHGRRVAVARNSCSAPAHRASTPASPQNGVVSNCSAVIRRTGTLRSTCRLGWQPGR